MEIKVYNLGTRGYGVFNVAPRYTAHGYRLAMRRKPLAIFQTRDAAESKARELSTTRSAN